MSSEWREFQLDEICDFVNGFAFKPENYIEKSADTYEVFRMGYISRGGGFKEDSSPVFVSRENPRLEKYRLRRGDIIIAMTDMKDKVAILGNTARVTDDDRFVLNQRAGLIRVSKPDIVCPVFLYYYSNWKPHVDYLRARANSGVQVNLSTGAIKEAKITLPPIFEQRQIGNILLSLDSRISLLRETNATLESIAQALFKSWFVDFDPVRAKMEGRTPEGMDEATAALFPDSFEESELGLVPRGWLVSFVSEVAEVVKGKSYSSKDLVDEHHTALVTLKSFERGGGFRLDGFKPYMGSYKLSQVVEPGDLIVAYTDVTQAAELIGKPAVVVGVEKHTTLVASLDVGIVRPDPERISRQFLYGLFRTDAFQSHTFSHTSGTTVLHLAKDAVGSFMFSCPPTALIEAFSEIAEGLARRRQTNIDQIRTLVNLRDTLLPRLISGQLRLPEANAIAQAAV
jgi:type I restriction enzyme S subunit